MTAGGAASGRKGSSYERKLVNALGDAAYVAMRAPSSGSATTDDLPDVIASKPAETNPEDAVRSDGWVAHDAGFRITVFAETWAIEHKSGKSTTLYVDEGEVDALGSFCSQFGARPLLGARFTTQATPTHHYLVPPENARRTQGESEGNYGLPVDDIRERAVALVKESGEVVTA